MVHIFPFIKLVWRNIDNLVTSFELFLFHSAFTMSVYLSLQGFTGKFLFFWKSVDILSLLQARNNCRIKTIWKKRRKLIKRAMQDFLQVHLQPNDWRNYRIKEDQTGLLNSNVLMFIGLVFLFYIKDNAD